jgi:hypothetical protein
VNPGCFSNRCNWLTDGNHSFAFVEYESRRDADDAYHEMHNKRIGRDDLLKIEVSGLQLHLFVSLVSSRYDGPVFC